MSMGLWFNYINKPSKISIIVVDDGVLAELKGYKDSFRSGRNIDKKSRS